MPKYEYFHEHGFPGASVLAVALDDEGKRLPEPHGCVTAYDRHGVIAVNPRHLATSAEPISEGRARELSPALFQELERD